MADHEIQLKYSSAGVTASPNPVRVRRGQTINFTLADGSDTGTIHIKFANPKFFSSPEFKHGDDPVKVVSDVDPTTYHCRLLVGGKVVSESKENAGGGVEPDTGNQS